MASPGWFLVPYILGFGLISYLFVGLAPRVVLSLTGVTLGAAVAAGVLTPVGLAFCLLFAVLAFVASLPSSPPLVSAVSQLVLVALSVALLLHLVPGFNNVPIVVDEIVSPGAIPFSLTWNFDKLLVGAGFLFLVRSKFSEEPQLNGPPIGWIIALVVTPIAVLGFAVSVGAIHLDPKLPALLIWWAPSVLFIASVSEEALFRGYLINTIVGWLPSSMKPAGRAWLALGVVSIVFGLAHFAGGWVYMSFAALAGFGYGLVYLLTGSLLRVTFAHFILNLAHISLFSYPILSSALPN